MSEKTKWEGLWYQKEGVYAGKVIKKADIPKYAKLIVRYNKYYSKDSNKPKFVYCFANGDSANAITMEVNSETFQDSEIMANRIAELEEQISNMYTHEQVQYAINMASEDAINGYTDNIVSDYL